jgi:signal transduction histidine kinase
LRAVATGQISRFYSLLEDAVESGSPEWLDSCLQDWANARSQSAFGERLTLLPVIDALKSVAWDVVRETCPPAEALELIVALELGFVHAQAFLSVIEVDALLRETDLKLQAARQDLERLDKSKTDFTAVAAHELKTPLTLIEGYADMLTDMLAEADSVPGAGDNQNPGAAFLITGISKGITRLREIVEDMIDLSMIDNKLLSLAFQPVQLLKLIEKAQTEMDSAMRQRRLNFVVEDFDGGDGPIVADPQRILQVFRQLILNAVKFTPDGGRITISGRRHPGFIEVMVADTGIGIAPENQQHIFNKYSAVGDVALHSTSKTKFKGGGTGLGLAIVRGIIEAHGGAIWCESAGHDERACPGSTFHIMLPELPPSPEAALLAGALRSTETDSVLESAAPPLEFQ